MKITHRDNRGTGDVPFGFVYFDDNTRVGYSPGCDVEVWAYEGPYWNTPTPLHVRAARSYLESQGVRFRPRVLP